MAGTESVTVLETDRDSSSHARSGGRVLVDQLVIQGVERVFSVPGESFLPVLEGLRQRSDAIDLVVARHEASAANMADAHGKLTGRPGVCFVTRGPGATHASVGLHTAFQDSTPLVLFVGQLRTNHLGREGFQELDVHGMFSATTKWVAQVGDPSRIPEIIGRAFSVAMSGRPGPVVVSLPEDVLETEVVVEDGPRREAVSPSPAMSDMETMMRMIGSSQRPVLLVGGGSWSTDTSRRVEAFARRNALPVIASFRRQDHIDNHSDQYVGYLGLATDPSLADRVRASDLVIAIGTRLGDVTTGGYTLIRPPVPGQSLVHVHPDPDELGTVYSGSLLIAAGPAKFAQALDGLRLVDSTAWKAWTQSARADYLRHLEPEPCADRLDLGRVMVTLRERLPRDAILTNGAGNYTVWLHRHLQFSQVRTQLAPTSGAMGYGIPAAIAAKAHAPDRTVVAFAGDGCFMMSGQELATACQYGLQIVIIVINNGMLATIRMHQERRFPGKPYGVDLINPDFARFAQAFGALGETVEETAEFEGALERALAWNGPALIELRTDPNRLTPSLRLD